MRYWLVVVFALLGVTLAELPAHAQVPDPGPVGQPAPEPWLPPAETEGMAMPGWVAFTVPALLTVGGIVGGAALDNKPGKWVILSSIVFLPSVGNVALGNNRWAGAWWALRMTSAGMMLPGLLMLTGDYTTGPGARNQVGAYFVFGSIMMVVAVFADLIGAYAYANDDWKQRRLSAWAVPTHSRKGGYGATAGVTFRF